MSRTLTLTPGELDLATLRDIWSEPARLRLEPGTQSAMRASAKSISEIARSGQTVYGVNTGFGLLAQTRISSDQLSDLQQKLVLSHSCGVGNELGDEVLRLVVALKAASLARGYSGVRPEIVERLLAFEPPRFRPLIPVQGSVGASGDLAPLAHLAAGLIGVGELELHGQRLPAVEGWRALGLEPITLGPKEGLALLNGTQVSTALALDALFRTERAFDAAICAGALSIDALHASRRPFDARIHAARGQPGQIDVASVARDLLGDSDIRRAHADCDKVQDPYSLRCQPQVMGACLDSMRTAGQTLRIEANAVTDNPLVFSDPPETISGGNFHAQPVAFAADTLVNAACEIGSISERRVAILIDPKMSGLPAFLVENSGVNSGFMIAQVTAAALVSENRTLAHPSSVDNIPTSANQEDHVSMATFGARRAGTIADNLACIVGIELLAAAQAVEFHHPLRTSPRLETVRERVRAVVPRYEEDRYFAPDLRSITELVKTGGFRDLIPDLLSEEARR